MVNYIAIAVPFFFLLIGLEAAVAWWQGKRVYRFNDAVTDMSCGIGQQVSGLFLKAIVFLGYLWVYEHLRALDLPADSIGTWAVAIIGVDFFYYWWHRLSHEVNFMWAAHIVHHQSEDYNLAVALRQAWFTSATGWVFYLPLAIIGVPPYVFLAADAISTLYQFWIHTELVGKLGPLEWVLNTPSHHRVHHAVNPHYLDKNYGAISIVWDRLFRSFQVENVRPVYGILKPFESWNAIWANFHYWVEIWHRAHAAQTWADKVRVWFADPGWDPVTHELKSAPQVDRAGYRKFDTRVPTGLNVYVAAQFVPIVAASTALMVWQDVLGDLVATAGALVVLLSVLVWGGLFELRRWALPLEVLRIALISGGILVLLSNATVQPAFAYPALAAGLVFLGWILRYRELFRRANTAA